jgi:hypothetical protein
MALLAPIVAVLMAAAASTGDVERAVVAPATRDLGLRLDEPGPLSILDWNDPEARRAHGLGEGAARRPVESFETALCELTADPRLQMGRLLPTDAADIDPAEAPPVPRPDTAGCGTGATPRPVAAFGRSGLGSGETAPDQWTMAGGVTVRLPGLADPGPNTADHAVSPTAWGELSSHPGLIQQPVEAAHVPGDKVKYQVLRDTSLGFDGHLLRVRLSYPKLDGH